MTDTAPFCKRKHKEFIKNNELILKPQQVFKSEKYVFTEEIDRISWSSYDDKKIQSIDLTETYDMEQGKI